MLLNSNPLHTHCNYGMELYDVIWIAWIFYLSPRGYLTNPEYKLLESKYTCFLSKGDFII